jgi:hypothetical protein
MFCVLLAPFGQVDTTASKLAEEDRLCSINYPTLPGCFIPHRERIEFILERKNDAAANGELINNFIIDSNVHTEWTYKTPPKPEEDYCRLNLNMIMDKFVAYLNEKYDQVKIKKASGSMISNAIGKDNFYFASSVSLPEPVAAWQIDGQLFGLFVSQAKAINNLISDAYVQAIQMACECYRLLYSFLSSLNTSSSSSSSAIEKGLVIPFMVCADKCVQFGVVYTIDTHYPCSALLSHELCLLDPDHLKEIQYWLIGIGALIHQYVQILNSSSIESVNIRYITHSLSLENRILKPIESLNTATMKSTSYCRLIKVLRVFKNLWNSEECRKYVCFPIGIVGFPNGEYQSQLRRLFKRKLRELAISCNKCSQDYYVERVDDINGYPCLIYEDLTKEGWVRCDRWMVDNIEMLDSLVKEVARALQLFAAAGVIHTDAREPNIFVRKSTADNTIQIRFIDWDDCLFVDDVVPESLRISWADANVRGFDIANHEFHAYYLSALREHCNKIISRSSTTSSTSSGDTAISSSSSDSTGGGSGGGGGDGGDNSSTSSTGGGDASGSGSGSSSSSYKRTFAQIN